MTRLYYLSLVLVLAACAAPKQPEKSPQAAAPDASGRSIERQDPAFDQLVPADATIEVLADGFEWTEGPLWIAAGGYLIFSDIPNNDIVKWKEGEGKTIYLHPAGYTGSQPSSSSEEGSNGLLLDSQGRLVLCQHGDRRMAYMDAPLDRPEPRYVTLADKYDGKRLNSPNDAVYDKAGNLYFTDPPYGLGKQMEDPAKEIPFQGVYRLSPDGQVSLLTNELSRPNGIALSPDEKTLYVANSDPDRAIWMAYDLQPDGTITHGRVLYDATSLTKTEKGLPDGMKVDAAGYIYATGPGGVWVFSAAGQVLGKVKTGEATANCALAPGYLYMTADNYLMRVALR